MLFPNIVKAFNFTSKRFVNRHPKPLKSWPNDWVPFYWERPQFIKGFLKGGDLEELGHPQSKDLFRDARHSQIIKELEPTNPARQIHSLDHGTRYDYIKQKTADHLNKMGLIHEIDFSNSREAKIVSLTFLIRGRIEIIQRKGLEDSMTNWIRTVCNSLVYRRHRYLCELKEIHSGRYKKLIKSLKIQPPDNPINVPYLRPYRKKQMRKLTIDYCRDLKEKKVAEYLKSLEKEKEEFEKEKQETLQWIDEQEKFLGITVN